MTLKASQDAGQRLARPDRQDAGQTLARARTCFLPEDQRWPFLVLSQGQGSGRQSRGTRAFSEAKARGSQDFTQHLIREGWRERGQGSLGLEGTGAAFCCQHKARTPGAKRRVWPPSLVQLLPSRAGRCWGGRGRGAEGEGEGAGRGRGQGEGEGAGRGERGRERGEEDGEGQSRQRRLTLPWAEGGRN